MITGCSQCMLRHTGVYTTPCRLCYCILQLAGCPSPTEPMRGLPRGYTLETISRLPAVLMGEFAVNNWATAHGILFSSAHQ